jgi:hypothetical protein
LDAASPNGPAAWGSTTEAGAPASGRSGTARPSPARQRCHGRHRQVTCRIGHDRADQHGGRRPGERDGQRLRSALLSVTVSLAASSKPLPFNAGYREPRRAVAEVAPRHTDGSMSPNTLPS